MADIKTMVDYAAGLLNVGRKIDVAVGKTLDRYGVTNPTKREAIFREICSELGKRGTAKQKQLRLEGKARAQQIPIRFAPPSK